MQEYVCSVLCKRGLTERERAEKVRHDRLVLVSASATLLLAPAIDFAVERPLDAVDEVGVVSALATLKVDDGARLFVDQLGQLRLCLLGRGARVLYRHGANVGPLLKLDFLVAIDVEIVVGDRTRVVLDLTARRSTRAAEGTWSTVATLGLDGTGHKHFALLAANLHGLRTQVLRLRLGLLNRFLYLGPISVHLSFNLLL